MIAIITRGMGLLTLMVLLASCASTKDVDEIKYLITENQEESYQLNNRIDLLRFEIEDDRIRLNSLEENGAGLSYEAMDLKANISKNQKLINALNHKMSQIKKEVRSNSNEIKTIKNEQKNKRRAIQEALLKNQETKIATSQGIKELEKQYSERRKYEAESWEEEK